MRAPNQDRIYYAHEDPSSFAVAGVLSMVDLRGEFDAGQIAFRHPGDAEVIYPGKRNRLTGEKGFEQFLDRLINSLPEDFGPKDKAERAQILKNWVLEVGLAAKAGALSALSKSEILIDHRLSDEVEENDFIDLLLAKSLSEIGYEDGRFYCCTEAFFNEWRASASGENSLKKLWALGSIGLTMRIRAELTFTENSEQKTLFPICTLAHDSEVKEARLSADFLPNVLKAEKWQPQDVVNVPEIQWQQQRDNLILGDQNLVAAARVWRDAYLNSPENFLDPLVCDVNVALKRYADTECKQNVAGRFLALERLEQIVNARLAQSSVPSEQPMKDLKGALESEKSYLKSRQELEQGGAMPVPREADIPGSFFAFYPLLQIIRAQIIGQLRQGHSIVYGQHHFTQEELADKRVYKHLFALKMIERAEKLQASYSNYRFLIDKLIDHYQGTLAIFQVGGAVIEKWRSLPSQEGVNDLKVLFNKFFQFENETLRAAKANLAASYQRWCIAQPLSGSRLLLDKTFLAFRSALSGYLQHDYSTDYNAVTLKHRLGQLFELKSQVVSLLESFRGEIALQELEGGIDQEIEWLRQRESNGDSFLDQAIDHVRGLERKPLTRNLEYFPLLQAIQEAVNAYLREKHESSFSGEGAITHETLSSYVKEDDRIYQSAVILAMIECFQSMQSPTHADYIFVLNEIIQIRKSVKASLPKGKNSDLVASLDQAIILNNEAGRALTEADYAQFRHDFNQAVNSTFGSNQSPLASERLGDAIQESLQDLNEHRVFKKYTGKKVGLGALAGACMGVGLGLAAYAGFAFLTGGLSVVLSLPFLSTLSISMGLFAADVAVSGVAGAVLGAVSAGPMTALVQNSRRKEYFLGEDKIQRAAPVAQPVPADVAPRERSNSWDSVELERSGRARADSQGSNGSETSVLDAVSERGSFSFPEASNESDLKARQEPTKTPRLSDNSSSFFAYKAASSQGAIPSEANKPASILPGPTCAGPIESH